MAATRAITFLLEQPPEWVYFSVFGAMAMGFTIRKLQAIGIIERAVLLPILSLCQLAKGILPAVAVAAYSYMSLVPLIQPPVYQASDNERPFH